VLEASVARVREIRADEDIVREGDRPTESNLLFEGFAARYKVLSNGRRQITAIHVTGDFVDLHSFLLKTMDHGILALTPCRLAVIPHAALERITEEHAHLTRLLWLSTLIDGAIHRQWLTGMGRLSATAHMAHLICELYLRLKSVGQIRDDSFPLPITQSELGDTLGLSTVHVNRVLQELRKEGLIRLRGNTLTILDLDRLQKVAEFTPTYLNLHNERR
jgi:CRP-like cAMP-binding protein